MDLNSLSQWLIANQGKNLLAETGYSPDLKKAIQSGDPNAVAAYLKANPNDAASFAGNGDYKNWAAVNQPGAPNAQQTATTNMLQFAQRMMGPLDMNDPQVKSVLNAASSYAGANAQAAGVSGGLSNLNTENSVAQAATGLQTQREQLGLQALGGAGNLGLAMTDQQYQMYLNQLGRQQGNGGSIGAAIGGVVGGTAGFLVGGPAGAAVGAGAGSSVGRGVGSAVSSQGTPSNYGGPGAYSSGGQNSYQPGQ